MLQLHCCGATNYTDWLYTDWFGNLTTGPVIPVSCCATVGGCGEEGFIFEDDIPVTYRVWTQVWYNLLLFTACNYKAIHIVASCTVIVRMCLHAIIKYLECT